MSGSGTKRLPSEVLKDWPSVDIDEEGVFKYVLIEAYAEDEKDGQVSRTSLWSYPCLKRPHSFYLDNNNQKFSAQLNFRGPKFLKV